MNQSDDKLLAAYLAGELPDARRAEFEAWLQEDPQRVRDLAELMLLDDQLAKSPLTDDVQPAQPVAGKVDRNNWRLPAAAWALAASVLVAAGVMWYDRDALPESAPSQAIAEQAPANRSATPAAGRVAAYLGRTTDCVWNGPPWDEGSPLTVGSQVSLAAGVAEVIFDNGARVKALGPCELFMDDAQACSLRVGNASVYVPESAFGFKVVTPSGIVVDLGTEFGVAVDQAGSSEVHVFQGEVAFQPLTARGDHFQKSIRLLADRACEYSIGGTTLREFEANEAKFHWRNRAPLADDQAPPLPVRDDLALWLAADHAVDADEANRVSRWSDLQVGGNASAEDALQLNPAHRPTLVDDAINGKPAVRFRDGAFLLTPPLATTNEQTAFVVLALGETQPQFQALLNYNGPPQRVVGPLGGSVSPSVFEICLRDRDHDGQFAVCGELFTGWRGAGRRVDDVIKNVVEELQTLKSGEPRAVAFRYSLADEQMALFLDGQQRQVARADTRIAITSRKIIGRHPILEGEAGMFGGDVAEVIIYNRALGDDDVLLVLQYLADRYELPP